MTQAVDSTISQTLTVDAPRDHAFAVFADIDSWWPREYNLLEVDIEKRFFEPHAGGRIYDRGTDGTECQWGKVLAYEPPERLVFGWALSPRWQVEEDDEKISEVEVLFTEESPERTRVDVEHRHMDRHGEGWEGLREQLAAEGGWPYAILQFGERIAAG